MTTAEKAIVLTPPDQPTANKDKWKFPVVFRTGATPEVIYLTTDADPRIKKIIVIYE